MSSYDNDVEMKDVEDEDDEDEDAMESELDGKSTFFY